MRFQQILYYASELQVGRRPKARLSDAHGQDWPVVIRKPDRVAAGLPLPALLSQVLAAFAIDYERERLGHLQDVSNFLRFVGDEGVPLGRAQVLGGISGNGKTAHERHVDVVVEPGRVSNRSPQPGSAPPRSGGQGQYPSQGRTAGCT